MIPQLLSSDPRIIIGQYTYGNPHFKIWGEEERIEIGAFCSIAEEVAIFGGGEHRTDWATTFPLRIAFNDRLAGIDGHPSSKGATKIGNDVWIGFRSIILSGVTIGDGAVIGAGAVVSRDILPYAIVAGNPARFVRYRFSEDYIKELLDLKWWEWDIDKIKENVSLLSSNNLNLLLQLK